MKPEQVVGRQWELLLDIKSFSREDNSIRGKIMHGEAKIGTPAGRRDVIIRNEDLVGYRVTCK